MAEAGNAPTPTVCRFHRDHTDPENQQPPGKLYHSPPGTQTLGFLRGKNLAVGQTVKVQTTNGNKVWEGSISQSVDDNWTREEGPAWFFALTCTKYTPSTDDEPTIEVTVTVTSTTNGSGTITAKPNPEDIP